MSSVRRNQVARFWNIREARRGGRRGGGQPVLRSSLHVSAHGVYFSAKTILGQDRENGVSYILIKYSYTMEDYATRKKAD